MNRKKRILINIIILILLFFVFLRSTGLYLTPLSAHRASERSIHYGPSEIVHVEDFPRGKYILGKYDKYISCNTVNKSLFFLWRIGNQVTGIENDKTKPINFNWSMSKDNYKFYGIINDDRIEKIEVIHNRGEVLTQTQFHDNMFIFTWESEDYKSGYVGKVKAYDNEGNLVFEDKF